MPAQPDAPCPEAACQAGLADLRHATWARVGWVAGPSHDFTRLHLVEAAGARRPLPRPGGGCHWQPARRDRSCRRPWTPTIAAPGRACLLSRSSTQPPFTLGQSRCERGPFYAMTADAPVVLLKLLRPATRLLQLARAFAMQCPTASKFIPFSSYRPKNINLDRAQCPALWPGMGTGPSRRLT